MFIFFILGKFFFYLGSFWLNEGLVESVEDLLIEVCDVVEISGNLIVKVIILYNLGFLRLGGIIILYLRIVENLIFKLYLKYLYILNIFIFIKIKIVSCLDFLL